MFFEYRQSNSGGSFDFDKKRGISVHVIIEADSPYLANKKAESIGLYFDGHGDCPCCGDRWYEQYDSDSGDEVPSVYGKPIEEATCISDWSRGSSAQQVYVHYADGRIVGHDLPVMES